ncbi:MAG: gamma-glutamylcyclotransferase family protein [Pseudomonadota bacterium]
MNDPYFFGYGSLVNTRSHDYPDPRPARLNGWRRAWVATPRFGVVLLTAVQTPGARIDGLIAQVPGADWNALDTREAGYARHAAHHVIEHDLAHDPDIAVYAVARENHLPPGNHVILLSYLDVVVQGFSDIFGDEGVARFFKTTDGWHTPVVDDRADPVYPRAQKLTLAQATLVDRHLAELGATIKPPDDVSVPRLF